MSPSSQEAPHLAALASAELHAHFLPYPSYRKLSHVDWFRLMLVERIESRNGALSSSPHPHGSYTMDIGVTTSIHIIIFIWKSKTPSFTPKIRLASIIFCTSLITAILLYGLVYCIFYFFYWIFPPNFIVKIFKHRRMERIADLSSIFIEHLDFDMINMLLYLHFHIHLSIHSSIYPLFPFCWILISLKERELLSYSVSYSLHASTISKI